MGELVAYEEFREGMKSLAPPSIPLKSLEKIPFFIYLLDH
jgi:hypothetical protein